MPLLFFNGQKIKKEFVINGYAQGTTYSIKYFANDPLIKKSSIDSIVGVIDHSMSLYLENSLINKFNKQEHIVLMDQHLSAVVTKSFKINKETDGFFDITVAPLVQMWGFGPVKNVGLPDSSQVAAALSCIGMNNLFLKKKQLLKSKECVQIDLNGIAQGYTVDLIADFLKKNKIKSFMVELGGEIVVNGTKPDGNNYTIGIEGVSEAENGRTITKIISLKKGAVTTSGSYKSYIDNERMKINHIINPKTGYPAQNNIMSVTLIGKNAISADGYDNSILLMDLNQAINFVNKKRNLEAYIIYKNLEGKVVDTMTKGFKLKIIN